MQPAINPTDLAQLAAAVDQSYADIQTQIEAVNDTQFHQRKQEKWSVGENVDHLVRSTMGIASILGRDKTFFQQFGAPDRPSFSYPDISAQYFSLIQGRTAPANVTPDAANPTSQAALRESWATIRTKIKERLAANWTEEELDQHLLPHPAFGKLTMREILYFVIFHNYHHLHAMQVAAQE